MNNIEIIESNYSLSKSNCTAFQFKFPLDFYTNVPNNDPVTSFVEIMKGLDTSKYFKTIPHRGNQGYDPHMMLNIVLFAFMNKVPSLRELETLCKYDIRYMWMADNETPSFMAFQRFISNTLTHEIEDIFYDVCHRLIELDNVDLSKLYIDGTKIEANAKKNSFVWKKSLINRRNKVFEKTTAEITYLNTQYKFNYETNTKYNASFIGQIADDLMSYMVQNKIDLVYGTGKRKHDIQKRYEHILDYYSKLMNYEEMLEICGDRNSYSKTDHDATMMNMKYDYYNKTGVFKPGYNVQIGTSDEYVVHIGVYPNPADTKTFIPFMKSYYEKYECYPKWPVADAGYGSYDNYMFCIINKMELGMKYSYYAKKNDSKFKKNIYHSYNFKKDEKGYRVCPEGHSFNIDYGDVINEKGDYIQISNIYGCGQCNECPVKEKCTKSQEGRRIQVNPILEEMYRKVDENLSTAEGKEMKKQRSIQTEGAFGVIKYDVGYERIRRRGIKNVKTELFLVFIGFNLRKYHHKKHRLDKESVS